MVLTLSYVAVDKISIAYAEEAQKESEQMNKEEKAHLEVEQILDKFNEISIECGN